MFSHVWDFFFVGILLLLRPGKQKSREREGFWAGGGGGREFEGKEAAEATSAKEEEEKGGCVRSSLLAQPPSLFHLPSD